MRFRVACLQHNSATGETTISSIRKDNQWQQIREYNITAAIKTVVRAAGTSICFTEAVIKSLSLGAGGDMALLMEQVDPDTIFLVGWWRSNTMIRYIQTKAKSFTEGLAANVFQHGTYALIPPVHAGK